MRVRPSILSVCVLLLAPAACANRTVEKVKQLADRACACTDPACADQVNKEYLELAQSSPKGTRDERDEVRGHYNRMRECIGKLAPGSSATAAPDAKSAAQPAGKTGGVQ